MATTSTPTWSAPHNGLIGDASATAGAGQINQMLGTHADTVIYQGAPITSNIYNLVTTTNPNTPWQAPLSAYDIDQPFTMSGTTIGRVALGMLPVGRGADLLVSLCSDNSGAPGAVVAQTRVPANWIYQLSPVSGVATGVANAPITNTTGNPLATAEFSAFYRNVATSISPYPVPAYTGIAAASSTSWYSPYLIQIGGVNNGAALTNVFTTPYSSAGALGAQIQQAQFPAPNDGSSMTCVVLDPVTGSPVVINTGGGITFEGNAVSTAYTATLNPATGSLSTWTQQTALLYPVQNHGFCASPEGFVYMVGGRNSTGLLNAVSYARVQNAQIGTWNYAIPLPQPVQLSAVGVTNGFLFVCGGTDSAFNPQPQVWYAPINSDGSLGAWIQGPSFPSPGFGVLNANPFTNDNGIICLVGTTQGGAFLPVTASGPASTWIMSQSDIGEYPGFNDLGNGIVNAGAIIPTSTPPKAAYASYYLAPQISVPLPASGLSNGATYHVLLQQQGGDLNDYLIAVMVDALTISGQSSPPGAYTWTTWPENLSGGRPVGAALTVYNNTPPQTAMPDMPLHLWEDNGAKITTLVTATTPDQRLLGVLEATRQAVALNQNTGFESGIAPWTCTGGTVTQSSTEVYTGQYAAKIVPSGSAASVILASEIMPCMPGQWCTATGWLWLTNAVTSNVSMSIAWYTAVSGGTSISTSASLVSVSAAWTQETQSLQAPAGAYGWQIQATLSGTPASSQVFYVDAIHGHYTYTGPQNSTVTEILWSGTGWPEYGLPTGTTQLA